MASAFNKEVRRSISRSIGRFLAIAVMAALGCGFYAGLRMTPLDMNLSADAFYDNTNLSDIYVSGTLGLEDADVDELAAIEGVSGIEPVRMADAYATLGDSKYVMSFSSLDFAKAQASDCSDGQSARSDDPHYINRPVLVEGSWPDHPGECVVAADAVLDKPVSIGDTIEIVENAAEDNREKAAGSSDDAKDSEASENDEGDEDDETFSRTSYTVTGLVRSPYFVMTSCLATSELGSGEIDTYVFISASDFAEDFPYTGAFITVDGAAAESYPSSGYDSVVDAVVNRIEDRSLDLRTARLAAVKAKAQEKLDEKRADYEEERADALSKLDDAADELSSAHSKLADAKAEITRNEKKLDDAKAAIEQGANDLAASKKELDAQQAKLDGGYEQYEAGAAELKAAKGQITEQIAGLEKQLAAETDPVKIATIKQTIAVLQQKLDTEIPQQETKLAATKKQLDEAAAKLAAGWKKYEAGVEAAKKGEATYESSKSKLKTGKKDYESGLAEYHDGMAEYQTERAEALDKLADAEAKLDDAQADIDAIELPDLYVLDRSKNVGVVGRKADAERIDQIAQVFPFIFFLVAALVSLTTMTRMVDEERMLIGTYKALGYSNARIASKYLIYALIASGAGSIVGILVLTQFLPQFIMQAYDIIYAIPIAVSPIDIPLALMAAGMAIGITVLATLLAALSTLRERPALLMLPRAPKPGKRILLERIGFIWRHLSFTWKVTARNIFRYKRRFLMAVIGIAGCTALLLTGLGLHNGINDIIDKQFSEIQHYNLTIQTSEEQSKGDAEEVRTALEEASFVTEVTDVASRNVIASLDGSDKDLRASIMVPEDVAGFANFLTLRERVGGAALELSDAGAVITEKLSMELDVSPGDVIEIYEQSEVGEREGQAHEVTVAGVTEYYTGQRIIMNPDVYERVMGAPAVFTDKLAKAEAPSEERTALADALLDIPGVDVVSYTNEIIDTYRVMLKTVSAVVVVLIVAAMLLAFVVLYNLTNINITERTREIATLKVLGFTPHETNAYIYRETILLTIIGALVGCLLGIWMEGFVVGTAEVDQMMFGREIHPLSFVIAFVLTVAFSVVVTLAMKPKLKAIDMVESLKSVD